MPLMADGAHHQFLVVDGLHIFFFNQLCDFLEENYIVLKTLFSRGRGKT